MKNRTRLIVAVAVLVGLSACTVREQRRVIEAVQRQQNVEVFDDGLIAGEVPPDNPHAQGEGDCNELRVSIHGLPDGAQILVSIGGQPPYGYVVGSPGEWQFDAAGWASIPVSDYDRVHGYVWTVTLGAGPNNTPTAERLAIGEVQGC